MISAAELQRRASERRRTLRRRRRDPRFQRVLGRFVQEGLLTTNQDTTPHQEPLGVAEVLWAGELEPRFLELLPALLVRRPALFLDPSLLPDDLAPVVRCLRRNLEPGDFRGQPGSKLYYWLSRVGRNETLPARLKSFRMKPDDLRILRLLSEELGITETEVVRRGIRSLL